MKFTNGYWKIRDGLRAYHPAEAYDLETTPHGLTVYAPTTPIRHRGDTLNGKMLTLHFSSPMPDVIRARVEHWQGGRERGPEFQVMSNKVISDEVISDETGTTLTSGRLSVRVRRDAWGVEYLANGRVLTRSGHKGLGLIETDRGEHYLHEQL
ncbi:MAG TPA: hypothetical protein PK530_24230, partial [Anaerolineales bacterium]|nr:hypothetical protein [Anaerolineales bacterium]